MNGMQLMIKANKRKLRKRMMIKNNIIGRILNFRKFKKEKLNPDRKKGRVNKRKERQKGSRRKQN
jgi:hypothetical protein